MKGPEGNHTHFITAAVSNISHFLLQIRILLVTSSTSNQFTFSVFHDYLNRVPEETTMHLGST